MSPNEKKVPGSKMPDWICNQEKGACLNDKGYPSAMWNPREGKTTLPAMNRGSKSFEEEIEKEQWQKKRDETGEKMNRSNLAAAWIQSNRPINAEAFQRLSELEAWSLERVVPQFQVSTKSTNQVMEKVRGNPKFQQTSDDLWGKIVEAQGENV